MAQSFVTAADFKRVLDLFQAQRIEEARRVLQELQGRFLSLCEENDELRRQMEEVAQVLDLSENMEFDGQKYWLVENYQKKGPYCQVCYDRDGQLIRLQEHDKHWHCLNCGNLYLKMRKFSQRRKPQRGLLGKTVPLFVE